MKSIVLDEYVLATGQTKYETDIVDGARLFVRLVADDDVRLYLDTPYGEFPLGSGTRIDVNDNIEGSNRLVLRCKKTTRIAYIVRTQNLRSEDKDFTARVLRPPEQEQRTDLFTRGRIQRMLMARGMPVEEINAVLAETPEDDDDFEVYDEDDIDDVDFGVGHMEVEEMHPEPVGGAHEGASPEQLKNASPAENQPETPAEDAAGTDAP